jgi:hypothetical protein
MQPRDLSKIQMPAFGGRPRLSYTLFANPHSCALFGLLLDYTCELLEFAVESRLKYTGSMLSGLG